MINVITKKLQERLQETLTILHNGSYMVNGETVVLKLSKERMEKVHVLLPENVVEICNRTDFSKTPISGRCRYSCEELDSFSAAIQQKGQCIFPADNGMNSVLVLNFANPYEPGGGVRRGARAQEEDLCRKSSLLLSLESEHAGKYYRYNSAYTDDMGSDAMMFTPEVEIIRDANGNLLEETVIVSVLTCAAPIISYEISEISKRQYEELFYNRIMKMLKCAAYFQYRNLVLGAWGCGAFGNDAAEVSDLFYKALKELHVNGLTEKDVFRRVDFAIKAGDPLKYNFKEFYRNFGGDNFYKDELTIKTKNVEHVIGQ